MIIGTLERPTPFFLSKTLTSVYILIDSRSIYFQYLVFDVINLLNGLIFQKNLFLSSMT